MGGNTMAAIEKKLKELKTPVVHGLFTTLDDTTICGLDYMSVPQTTIYVAELNCENCIEVLRDRIKNPR